MSASNISSFNFATQQITIYLGIPILIAGLVGDFINVIVFLSLQTFRENSCAFYLTIMSAVNIGQLITGLFSRIMISGFNIDWQQSSLFYCKFRPYCFQSCVSISMTCACLATIDQFLATCYSRYWQQWSHITVARRLTIGSVIVWLVCTMPCWIYYDQMKSLTTGQRLCVNTNEIFQIYILGVQTVVFNGLLPITISILFGLLAYRNVRDLAYRTTPLVRRELDKQLTVIVLVQVIFNSITISPYIITYILLLNAMIMKDAMTLDKLRLMNILTIPIFYLNFASPFYIYICVSGRFRQQFIYVFFKMYLNKWRHKIIVINQVIPQG